MQHFNLIYHKCSVKSNLRCAIQHLDKKHLHSYKPENQFVNQVLTRNHSESTHQRKLSRIETSGNMMLVNLMGHTHIRKRLGDI